MNNQPNQEQCEKLYDAIKSGKIDAKKIIHDLEANLSLVSKIAKQTSKEEFVDAMNGEMPALRLTPPEMELLKGGIIVDPDLTNSILLWLFSRDANPTTLGSKGVTKK
jgi:hypothetical protein